MLGLGRNQTIAVITYGVVLVSSLVLVALDRVMGQEWLTWAQTFAPLAVGSMLGASALVKAADAIGGKRNGD